MKHQYLASLRMLLMTEIVFWIWPSSFAERNSRSVYFKYILIYIWYKISYYTYYSQPAKNEMSFGNGYSTVTSVNLYALTAHASVLTAHSRSVYDFFDVVSLCFNMVDIFLCKCHFCHTKHNEIKAISHSFRDLV